ncbi:MAG: UDP-3-O-(3-hydroxymyristoyl)glucosamine N-acyltransferase [Gammaproteobacteria bacterium]|nr:UDP-3-O-(3-hydroxymyristoyl)glucosamine N-acyltransferase [Gammaproteobacteria bacterium]
MSWTLAQLAERLNAQLKGDGECEIHSVATLQNAGQGQISFFTNGKYKSQLLTTRASAVIVHPDFESDCPVNAIIVANPHAAYARVAQMLHPYPRADHGAHPSAQIAPDATVAKTASIGANAVIDSGAQIGEGVVIGANAYIGKNARIGTDSRIFANVTVCDDVVIGERVILHPGAVIGADGFGQAYDKGLWVKVPQIGGVRLGNDVEIGANTTVDRGAIEDTVIEDGVKLDNQIQIAHNVRIGAHTVMAATSAVAGSTTIGSHCMIAGAVAIAGHLTIADNVTITGMTMITKSITEAGSYSSGISAETTAVWHRLHARLKKLDDMAKRFQHIEKKLKITEE